MEKKAKLKPCPFCGVEPYLDDRHGEWFKVACDNPVCHVSIWTAWHEDKKQAIAAWNRRVKP